MGSVEGVKLSSGPMDFTGADLRNAESVPVAFMLIEGTPIHRSFVDSSAVMVEEK